MGNRRGSVGRAFSRAKRYREDAEWREKIKEENRKRVKRYYQRNKKRVKERIKELDIFANKRCKKCKKLLGYKNKSGFCKKHCKKRGGKKDERDNFKGQH